MYQSYDLIHWNYALGANHTIPTAQLSQSEQFFSSLRLQGYFEHLILLFQQSAGIFSHLKSHIILEIQQEPTPDMSPETLEALSMIMLAQAQEIFTHKAIHDNMKESIVAKLAAQTEEYYSDVLRILQKEIFRAFWDKEWIPLVSILRLCHYRCWRRSRIKFIDLRFQNIL
ncbi:hypothetical protein QAD02_002441 [Eretmocerus hayati]|uniref:Uncharacterized protein n=1 Tax=Eretmocerus hayati TaxID=131215 RepID=A0ACC2NJ97_9HYME|nr:hypothetical protein QAD02_002441 [Eretmocerus hayati]